MREFDLLIFNCVSCWVIQDGWCYHSLWRHVQVNCWKSLLFEVGDERAFVVQGCVWTNYPLQQVEGKHWQRLWASQT